MPTAEHACLSKSRWIHPHKNLIGGTKFEILIRYESMLLYRTKGVSFSIEKVFKQIRSALDKNIEQSDFYCPFNSYKNPLTYIRNFAALRRKSADIFHITGAVHYLALFLPARKTIITVHDLGHALKTKGIVGFFLRQLFAILPLKKAKYIVAISNFSKMKL